MSLSTFKAHWMFGEPRSKFLRLAGWRLTAFETDPTLTFALRMTSQHGQVRASPPVPPRSIVAAISF
jgi:hypothetical protein